MDQMRGDIDIRTLCFDLDSFNKLIAPPTVYNCVHACSLKKSQRRLPKNLGWLVKRHPILPANLHVADQENFQSALALVEDSWARFSGHHDQ